MKHAVKRIMRFRFDRYRDIELKLEKMAEKGFFLIKIGTLFWTFEIGTPKRCKYVVTYFSEASIFNPTETDNQRTYFDYAKESGWDFVAQFNQMQVFVSEDENPVPFETDEREKLANIKKCMGKSFLPSTFLLIFAFSLNVLLQINSFKESPTDFLAHTYRLYPALCMLLCVIYFIYTLLSYYTWCKRSLKSIAMGGGCAEKEGGFYKIIDITVLVLLFCGLGLLLLDLAESYNLAIIAFMLLPVPFFSIVFQSSIHLLKKKKQSAAVNRAISYSLVALASIAYIAVVVVIVMRFDIQSGDDRPYRIVSWQVTPSESREYKLYNDELPLTCEDLYGDIDYDYYSYEAEIDDSMFLTRSSYRQNSLPGKDSPPRIEYTIVEPKFSFVYDLVANDFKHVPEWRNNKVEPLDNTVFGTKDAYQFTYDTYKSGEYLLLYENQIVLLNLQEPLAEEQISVIVQKLGHNRRIKR